jgi:protein-disulfide isomerase
VQNGGDSRGSTLTLPVGPRDHVRGGESARVTLVEYGDFECPQCGQAFPIVERLIGAFGDRLRFVFRNFPITTAHPHAQHAAEEAEWAAAAGTFWPMYAALYEHGQSLTDGRMLDLARGLGLDAGALAEAWRAHTFIKRVKEDFLSGIESGVEGTPAFFINGVLHDGAWDEATLGRALEDAAR